jgi:CRISPR-associated protein Csd1
MEKLYQTYEAAILLDLPAEKQLTPISHISQKAHINIVIDGEGNFRRASVLEKNTQIFLPASEKSATGKTGKKPLPSPLAEKLRYVAKDYLFYGGKKAEFFNEYSALLKSWCDSKHNHPKANAVFNYISKGNVVADLVKEKILFTEVIEDREQLTTPKKFEDAKNKPEIFKVLTKDNTTGVFDQGDALVCWSVEIKDDPNSETWKNKNLQDKWNDFNSEKEGVEGLCFVTGQISTLAYKHPAKIRHSGDSAKLISSNDWNGFTFLGKFTDTDESVKNFGYQSVGIGLVTTQKAHSALQWLISRQGHQNGDQAYVSWAVSGKQIPEPLADTSSLFDSDEFNFDEIDPEHAFVQDEKPDYSRDLGQLFALKLKKHLKVYAAKLSPNEQIIIMGIDSTNGTKGRMSIIYYRELFSHDFFDRVERWHNNFAWQQNYGWDNKAGKKVQFVGAPSPKDISEVAYGHRDDKGILLLDDKLQKATVERLLPCIIDASLIPRDLVELTCRRACNRLGMKKRTYNGMSFEDDWEKTLGIACALYKGFNHKRREYAMALEENYHSRDYLYGRLLAIAERIEDVALSVSGENRSTTAARLMQRFADRPFETWRTIELALQPYMQRLRVSRAGFFNQPIERNGCHLGFV